MPVLRVNLHDFDVSQREHLFRQRCIVVLVVDDPHDASLDDLFCAQLARERGRVDGGSHGSWSTSFYDCRLLGVQANTVLQVDALADVVVAALAATFVAVGQIERGAIVARRDHSVVLCNDSSVSSLHAVGARRCQLGHSHEVGVEGWSH